MSHCCEKEPQGVEIERIEVDGRTQRGGTCSAAACKTKKRPKQV